MQTGGGGDSTPTHVPFAVARYSDASAQTIQARNKRIARPSRTLDTSYPRFEGRRERTNSAFTTRGEEVAFVGRRTAQRP